MMGGVPAQYEFPEGHHLVKLYPVEGDSAIAELWFGSAPWAQVTLEGIHLDQLGEERTRGVRLLVSLFGPPEGAETDWWQFDLLEVQRQLALAQDWLIENERLRVPLTEDGLTAAAEAMEKAAKPDALEQRAGPE